MKFEQFKKEGTEPTGEVTLEKEMLEELKKKEEDFKEKLYALVEKVFNSGRKIGKIEFNELIEKARQDDFEGYVADRIVDPAAKPLEYVPGEIAKEKKGVEVPFRAGG